jgi:hypothetical protein
MATALLVAIWGVESAMDSAGSFEINVPFEMNG